MTCLSPRADDAPDRRGREKSSDPASFFSAGQRSAEQQRGCDGEREEHGGGRADEPQARPTAQRRHRNGGGSARARHRARGREGQERGRELRGGRVAHPRILLEAAKDDPVERERQAESLRLESAGTTAPSWEHVRAAVVQTSPRGRAIHSAVDWQVATKAAGVPSDGPVTAITGALVLEEEAVVGWDYRQRRNAGVTRWSFLPAVLSLREGQELADTPCPLAATDDDGRARVPTSPTSFAEDILSVAIEALLEGEHPSMQQRGSMPPAPELDVDATGWLRWFLARPFFSAKLDPRDGDDVLAQPPPAGRWNLWIVRR